MYVHCSLLFTPINSLYLAQYLCTQLLLVYEVSYTWWSLFLVTLLACIMWATNPNYHKGITVWITGCTGQQRSQNNKACSTTPDNTVTNISHNHCYWSTYKTVLFKTTTGWEILMLFNFNDRTYEDDNQCSNLCAWNKLCLLKFVTACDLSTMKIYGRVSQRGWLCQMWISTQSCTCKII